MVEFKCIKCNKIFNKKSSYINHTVNKKKPCVPIIINNKDNINYNFGADGVVGANGAFGAEKKCLKVNISNNIKKPIINNKIICRYCCKEFLYNRNLNKHIREERCSVLKLQKQQKENIFLNLVKEDELNKTTYNKLNELFVSNNSNLIKTYENNKISLLIKEIQQIKIKFEKKLEEHKKEIENKLKVEFNKELKEHKKEIENKLKLEFENELENKLENKLEIKLNEEKNKIVLDKYSELEKNNIQLQKLNYKLQNKMDKIVSKNKIKINNNNTNTQNITNNLIVNNPIIKLVDFGNENLENISHNIFIETIKSQGIGLYNKAIEGIHFNKDYPENQNIYISDFNRDKVMIYKNEKWFLDNWDSVFPELLEKVIQFGYDKNEFLSDCNYKLDGKKFNKQMIKNGMRWYKLLNEDEPDTEYFTLEEDERPKIDEQTYCDYLEMQEFRKKHPKKQTETNIKNKIKLNIYNKREIPIENYKKITNIDMNKVKLIE